mgnify:CR=1 FL=1
MYFDQFSKPLLTEPGIKYYINETLKQCTHFRNEYHNLLVNIGLGVLFCLILGGFLVYNYKGKLTPAEKMMREQEKQQYILRSIRNYQNAKVKAQQELITGLPQWENEYDNINNKLNINNIY